LSVSGFHFGEKMTNPDVEVSDESYIQIITVSRDYLSHNQTLPSVATSQAVSQGFNTIIWLDRFEL